MLNSLLIIVAVEVRMEGRGYRYNMIDTLTLGIIAAVGAVVFYAAWPVYYAASAAGGPITARLISYGMWFFPAPLAASLIRKPLSALLGETLPALIESIIPTPGGFTNLIYGLAQGFFSELVYAAFRYKRYGLLQAGLAGALPAIPAVSLDAILFSMIYPWSEMSLIIVAAAVSGAIYGAIAYYIARVLSR